MLILIKYILPLCLILLLIWVISYAVRRLRYGKSTATDEQTLTSPRQIAMRLFGVGLVIAKLLAVYLKNS